MIIGPDKALMDRGTDETKRKETQETASRFEAGIFEARQK
jgi:hypothetical protein